MMRTLTSLMAAGMLLAAPLAAGGFGDDDDETVVRTSLSEVRRTPEAFKNVRLKFTVQFAWIGRLENPFFTRFTATRFTNFQAWSDQQQIWKRERFDDAFGLLFLSKKSDQLKQLFQTKIYQRLDVDAVVRNTFQGEPWIEVLAFTPVEHSLNTATLTHLYRGETHIRNRRWKQAISELSMAPVSSTPSWVQAAVHRDLGRCYLRLGEADEAQQHLSTAMTLMGDDVDVETWQLANVASTNPEAELDRAVDQKRLRDHERPMWEAFENPDATTRSRSQRPAQPPQPQK